jgi:D-alanine-D-alanine ligase
VKISPDHFHFFLPSHRDFFSISHIPFPISVFFSKKVVAREKTISYLDASSRMASLLPASVVKASGTTGDRDRMTRIGFAYNQKPDDSANFERQNIVSNESSTGALDAETSSFARNTSAQADIAVSAPAVRADDIYAEWDSPATIAAVERALSALGDVIRLEATPDFPQLLRETRPDIVFNMAEGLSGQNREAHVPAICEFYGVPYSGSDPLTLSLCLHKGRTKQMLQFYDIPTANFALVDTLAEAKAVKKAGLLRYPLFAKPVQEGSSKGITERNYIRDRGDFLPCVAELLEVYEQPVLIEEFLPGAEFTCGVIGNGREARVLPLVGMRFDALPPGALPIYGFEAKWVWDTPDEPLQIFECPAKIDESLRTAIEQVTLRAYYALGCRDWSRIDVRLDATGTPNIVEINPLPGILPNPEDNSCLPKAAAAAGISYDELIQSALTAAAKRHGVRLGRGRRGKR